MALEETYPEATPMVVPSGNEMEVLHRMRDDLRILRSANGASIAVLPGQCLATICWRWS
ncbi:hypothetical protein [Noviherbaspirillum sp.]|uniref:hypothetical protein n=1 Tax=Noviherbaspirillum sp. TaxID=1926288 RepID=UPI002FE37B43